MDRRQAGCILAAAYGLMLAACQHSPDSVVAVTGTVIGVELGENPANQTFQGKLGYNRSEVAIVPTNKCGRSRGDAARASQEGKPNEGETRERQGAGHCQTTGNGAADTADVLMELHYKGILEKGGGIYQRLAVGKNAVKATPTLLMFATPPGATTTPSGQAALIKAAREQVATEDEKIGFIVKCNADAAGTAIDAAKLTALVDAASIPDADKRHLKAQTTAADLRKALADESPNAIDPLFDALPSACKP